MADPKDEATGGAGAPGVPSERAETEPAVPDRKWTLGDAPKPTQAPPSAEPGLDRPASMSEPAPSRADVVEGSVPPPPLAPPPPARPAPPPRRPFWRRALRALSTYFGVLLVLAIAIGMFLLHSAATGKNLPMLRSLVGGVGRVISGQRTEQLDLQVRIRPDARELGGVAHLEVRATAPRGRVYFLLNDGLRVRRVWAERPSGAQIEMPFYRVWLFVVIDLPQTLAADEAARIGIEYGGRLSGGSLGITSGTIEPDDVLLSAYDFWYPSDLQSFFTATVEATVPARLTVVHNGEEQGRDMRGDSVTVRWTTARPVPGFALVAGHYREFQRAGARRYRLFLPAGVDLDAERLLSSLAAAEGSLTDRYGPSGFPQVTLVVRRGLDRAFNDGSGLLAIAPRHFRRGDYGFATIAHEVAHDWWGGTVAERWLQPATGGEWIVEGVAEFSSLIAVREELGQAALVEHLRRQFYDPTTAGVLAQMSALDNGLNPNARATIYDKGAYVTFMLARLMGEDEFFIAMRELLDKFRYQQITDRDVEGVLKNHSQADVGGFMDTWVRSTAYLDLALDPQDGNAAIHNLGTATPPSEVSVWRFPTEGEPERETVAPGASASLGSAARLVLDPLLAAADMYRDNNVLPRWPNPRAVARSSRGELLVVYGEPCSWCPARVTQMAANGQSVRSWEFDRGMDGDPAWSVDGTRILAFEKDRTGLVGVTVLNATDGGRQAAGPASAATAAADWIVVARGDRLVQIKGGGRETTLVQQRGAEMKVPLSSPDGAQIAYVAQRPREMDLRVMDAAGTNDRLLITWQPGEVKWVWSADASRLFVVLPGDWDWHLWEIPIQGAAPRVIVKEAASIPDLAAARDGTRIAFTAAPTIDYGAEHHEVFVVEHTTNKVQRIRLADADVQGLAWLDDETVVVVASDPTTPALPAHRELRRLSLSDESSRPFP